MSLVSMTGFGGGSASARGLTVEVELSSVNRRQLDLVVHLPRSLAALEARVVELLRGKLARGRVSATITLCDTRPPARRITVDHDLAAAYAESLRKAARKAGLDEHLEASLLLQLPGVVGSGQNEHDTETQWPCVSRAVRKALQDLVRMRREEGQALQQDLERRLALLRNETARIRRHAAGASGRHRKLLTQRLEEAGLPVDLKDERLLREIALFADRSDITEELTRLDSHFQQVERSFRAPGPAGRALDFLAQEMFREMNTIASKANHAPVAHAAVRFKAELERMREQVQNIE